MNAPPDAWRHPKGQARTGGKPHKKWIRAKDNKPLHKAPSPKRKQRQPVKAKLQQKKKSERTKQPQQWLVDITKEKIASCPLISWEGPVKLLRSFREMKDGVKEILDSGETHLGFDTETRPNFVKGRSNKTALVQLATSQTVYLFRICGLKGHNFDPLLPILTDPKILKTGVAIDNDVKELQQIQDFPARGFVDTGHMAVKKLRIRQSGLRALAAHFLNGRLSKKEQMSNWAAATLSPRQVRYAATDAWVSREIHIRAERPPEAVGGPSQQDGC